MNGGGLWALLEAEGFERPKRDSAMTTAAPAGAGSDSSARAEASRRLAAAAEAEGLDAATVAALDDAEPADLVALSDAVLRVYAQSLVTTAKRRDGIVPDGWTVPATCSGCGPVWLWPGVPARVIACPWCWNRADGLPIPSAAGPF